MNVHHLELFYYVARHGGISAAVRQMPNAVERSTISKQLTLLESHLKTPLFVRPSFALTARGRGLFDFVTPFFRNLVRVEQQFQTQEISTLRFGGSEVLLMTYVPDLIELLQRRHPQMQIGMKSGSESQMQEWLESGVLDILIAPLAGKSVNGTRCSKLVQLGLVLLVPRKHPVKEAKEFWAMPRITDKLIVPGSSETILRSFFDGLRALGVEWNVGIEASSLQAMVRYVARGDGVGLAIDEPTLLTYPGVRALPLAGFTPVDVALSSREIGSDLHQLLVTVLRHRANRVWAKSQPILRKPARETRK